MIYDLSDLPTWRAHVWMALTRLGLHVEPHPTPGVISIRPPRARRAEDVLISSRFDADETPERRALYIARVQIAPSFSGSAWTCEFRDRDPKACGQWYRPGRDLRLCGASAVGRWDSYPACASCLQDARKREGLAR